MVSFGVVAAAHGLVGADLSRLPAPGVLTMAIRRHGRLVEPTPTGLAAAFADASGHIAVFVHGVCDDDSMWHEASDSAGGLAACVEAQTDATVLTVRYNTGLSVAQNGAELARLLARVERWWPTSVTRMSLIGHGMGAMVVKASVNRAVAAHEVWPTSVRATFTMGLPHAGGLAHRAAYIVSRLSRMLTGVQLTPVFGYLDEKSWDGREVTQAWGSDRLALRAPSHAAAHFVAGIQGQMLCHPWVVQRALVTHPDVRKWLIEGLKAGSRSVGELEVR